MNELTSFATELGLWYIEDFSIQVLAGILADPSKYYRSFDIPKRRGGIRRIDAPYPVLAQVQRALACNLQGRWEVSEHAYAYQKGRNAIMHASAHLGCDELLTVDIQDFFGSITRQQINQTLLDCGFESSFSHIASIISTLNGVLPQGGCTSPILSNLIFRSLDVRLSRLSSLLGISYSRYADDLAFSGRIVPRNLPRTIEKILSSKCFKLNPGKTSLKIKGTKKILTGVSISSGKLKAPRTFVRVLRAEVHFLEYNENKLSSFHNVDPLKYERVLGKLNYWLQIEPNNVYANEKKAILSDAHQKFLSLSIDFNLNDYISKAG